MNNTRRKSINAIADKLRDISLEIAELRDAEQDAFDNLPECLQGSEQGERSEQAASQLEFAFDEVEQAISSLEQAVE